VRRVLKRLFRDAFDFANVCNGVISVAWILFPNFILYCFHQPKQAFGKAFADGFI
jgi:hypothetical protein